MLCLIIMSIYHEEMNFLEVFHLNFVSECSARDEVYEFLCVPYIVHDYQEEWREIKKANKNSICNFFFIFLCWKEPASSLSLGGIFYSNESKQRFIKTKKK